MLSNFAHMLVLLLGAHFLADFPLQGEFLSKCKHFRDNPHRAWMPWYCAMFAHAMIHAAAVQLITGSFWLGMSEMLIHLATDVTKNAGKISGREDQLIHVACKILWAAIAVHFIK